ncbi:glycosyltransferase family 2 protein [Endozoicomonas ascidiicola]|uniref:glycosyltransferase family 2 protein n=1 Tax=Endozoicomonas ascidiicola TaxID=1698521 RepID=UPI000831A11D|nr:glycosyltransferase [Endozoicomonas ascidiicola]
MTKVDIIVPVYNAFPFVEKCINSIEKHIDHWVKNIIIYDDCSSSETAKNLDAIKYGKVKVIHGETNLGYGGAVNAAFKHTSSDLVLVLNSDTEAYEDFVEPLIKIMLNREQVAAVNPVYGIKYANKYKEYSCRDGYVKTYQLSGYAYLIRRVVFDQVGGFRKEFGRGYFEDHAIARDICSMGLETGLCVSSFLPHAVSQSFSSKQVSELLKRNEVIFDKLFPASKERILVVGDVTNETIDRIEAVCRQGGKVFLYGGCGSYRKSDFSAHVKFLISFFEFTSLINRYIVRAGRNRKMITKIWLFGKGYMISKKIAQHVSKKYKLPIVR